MGGFKVVACAVLGVAVGACAAPDVLDLSQNERLYRATGYTALPGADRIAFVAPVVDARETRIEEATDGYTVQYFPDSKWHAAPVRMVDAILRDELTQSGVFKSVDSNAGPSAFIVKAHLAQFDVGMETHVTGWRSFAAVRLRVQVLGQPSPNGRPVLIDREFADNRRSEVDWRPPPAAALMGMSVRRCMQQALAMLDQSNIGRSQVPLDVQ